MGSNLQHEQAQCLILSLILNLSVYPSMSAGYRTYDKEAKQHLSSSEMKQASNVPLSSWQTRTQTEKSESHHRSINNMAIP